mgnify:CR=1 FL=1
MATINKGDAKALAVLILFMIALFTVVMLIAVNCDAANKDYRYLDSTFRKMETVAMKEVNFNGRQFSPDAPVKLPKVTDQKNHVWTIRNLIVVGNGLDGSATNWEDAHNYQTFRTINIENATFYNCDVGLIIQGSHRSYFKQLSFYDCRVGARFQLCLEGMATELQAHLFKDTGIYVGWGFNMAGANRENSQSNNFRIYGFRSYGIGTGTALIYNCVYGGLVEGLCDEGWGCDVFLLIDATNSTTMKSFTARQFGDIECHNNDCVVKVIGNGTRVYLSDFYFQVANIVVSGGGNNSSIYISQLMNTNVDLKYKNAGTGVNTLWWRFEDVDAKNGSIYNDANWVIDAKNSKPNPYAVGQTTNNSGSSRLYEVPPFTK